MDKIYSLIRQKTIGVILNIGNEILNKSTFMMFVR